MVSIYLLSVPVEEEKWLVQQTTIISISLYDSKRYPMSIVDWVDRDINRYEDGFLYPDFSLVERSPIVVAESHGQKIVFEYSQISDSSPSSRVVRIPMKARIVFFTAREVVWQLAVSWSSSGGEQAEADFAHILQTFKILD